MIYLRVDPRRPPRGGREGGASVHQEPERNALTVGARHCNWPPHAAAARGLETAANSAASAPPQRRQRVRAARLVACTSLHSARRMLRRAARGWSAAQCSWPTARSCAGGPRRADRVGGMRRSWRCSLFRRLNLRLGKVLPLYPMVDARAAESTGEQVFSCNFLLRATKLI